MLNCNFGERKWLLNNDSVDYDDDDDDDDDGGVVVVAVGGGGGDDDDNDDVDDVNAYERRFYSVGMCLRPMMT